MKVQKILFALAILISLFQATSVRADIMSNERIRGEAVFDAWATFRDKGNTTTNSTSPFRVTNTVTGDEFIGFCSDFRVQPGYNFIGDKGHPYSTTSLETATIYSDLQKQQLTDLYGYAYGSAFDSGGNLLDQSLAQAIQIATWEILTESGNDLGIGDGTFLVSSVGNTIRDLVNGLLDALTGEISWDDLDYTWNDYEMWVHTADNGQSQSLISVSPVDSGGAATPEPASMLIVGVGLAGLGLASRRRKK